MTPAGTRRVLVVCPDGLSVRTFLTPEFLEPLAADAAVTVWHDLPDATVHEARERLAPAAATGVDFARFPVPADTAWRSIVRDARTYAQLLAWDEPAAQPAIARARAERGWRRRVKRTVAMTMARRAGRRGWPGVAALDRRHERLGRRASVTPAVDDALRAVAPDVVFVTNQRSLAALPVAAAARQAGVPVASFVYSWDNLPKRRSIVAPDHWLVWGPRMAGHVRRYHPDVEPGAVHVVGTPQFQPHFDGRLRQPRETFLGSLGLDPSRPVVCFSGDDATTSPHDPAYLADVLAALDTVPAARRPQVLFRRAPVDRTGRWDAVLAARPDVAVCDPDWEAGGDWTSVVPRAGDAALLANVVHHCAAAVNLGSTIAMDFAVAGKPAVYLAYQPAVASPWRVDLIYALPHFRSVHRTQPVHWAREPGAALAATILEAVERPGTHAAGRAAWLAEELTAPYDDAAGRCARAVLGIAAAATPSRASA